MTQEFKDVLSDSIYNTIGALIYNNIDCSIIVHNHNNWDKELPDRLKGQPQFIMSIKEQTMEDSYIDEGKIIISTTFDGEEYSKEFEKADIGGLIGPDGKTPLMVKPFMEQPTIPVPTKTLGNGEIDENGVLHSMEMFKRNNPEMF